MPVAKPKPPKELLWQLYHVEKMSYRQIMEKLNINTARAIKRWLTEYEIPIRTGGEAIKTQWENNEERRKRQSEKTKLQFYGNTQRRIDKDVYSERLKTKKIIVLDRWIENGYSYFKLQCETCNHVFKRSSKNINYDGCPNCRASKGELKICDALTELGFTYKREYKFNDCIHKRRLRFDFAVFQDEKVICLIEYDGEFHFGKIIKKDEKGERFKKTLERDRIKNDYCKKKRIKLIRISFINFQNIKQIIADNLIEQPSLF